MLNASELPADPLMPSSAEPSHGLGPNHRLGCSQIDGSGAANSKSGSQKLGVPAASGTPGVSANVGSSATGPEKRGGGNDSTWLQSVPLPAAHTNTADHSTPLCPRRGGRSTSAARGRWDKPQLLVKGHAETRHRYYEAAAYSKPVAERSRSPASIGATDSMRRPCTVGAADSPGDIIEHHGCPDF